MGKTLLQIIQSILELVFLLIIPTFIMFNFGSEEMRKTPQITSEGLQSGEVLVISDQNVVLDYSRPFQSLLSLSPYFLLFLAVISIISFIRFKLDKK